jgi:hypothetical protein
VVQVITQGLKAVRSAVNCGFASATQIKMKFTNWKEEAHNKIVEEIYTVKGDWYFHASICFEAQIVDSVEAASH